MRSRVCVIYKGKKEDFHLIDNNNSVLVLKTLRKKNNCKLANAAFIDL